MIFSNNSSEIISRDNAADIMEYKKITFLYLLKYRYRGRAFYFNSDINDLFEFPFKYLLLKNSKCHYLDKKNAQYQLFQI